jgi:hypothetical protein
MHVVEGMTVRLTENLEEAHVAPWMTGHIAALMVMESHATSSNQGGTTRLDTDRRARGPGWAPIRFTRGLGVPHAFIETGGYPPSDRLRLGYYARAGVRADACGGEEPE